jgi:hypothetical protein
VRSFIILVLHRTYYDHQIEEGEMSGTCGTYKILLGNPEGKRHLGKAKEMFENVGGRRLGSRQQNDGFLSAWL